MPKIKQLENEVKKLIKKWNKNYRIIQSFDNACEGLEKDLQSLLELYQSQNKEIPTIHNTIYRIGEK